RTMRLAPLAGSLAALALACQAGDESQQREQTQPHGARAKATIEGRSGSTLGGQATFTEVEGGVQVEIEVHHAPPGWHAAHGQEKGDRSDPEAKPAGGHSTPASKNHGSPQAPEHHAGDFGNLYVDEHGDGRLLLIMPDLTVKDGPSSVRGRAIVIHANLDDLVTQPSGNAGGRIGCGVIQ